MRTLFGVAASLAAMAAWCVLFLAPLYLVLGPEAALSPARTEFSTLWVGLALVVCLGAAMLGGWLVHRLTDQLSAVVVLTGVVLVVGLADAAFNQWGLSMLVAGLAAASPVTTSPSWFQLLLMPEPAWYDWMLPPAMAAFAWVIGSGRALENAPEPPSKKPRARTFRTSPPQF